MRRGRWNHNIHYHGVVLRAMPPGSRLALDVGCGRGHLARELAQRCSKVIALDRDPEALAGARREGDCGGRITFLDGDVMAYPLPRASFDFIAMVATLHHLPLSDALERMCALLAPGGVLAVVGLYRARAMSDFAVAAAAVPANLVLRIALGEADIAAPLSSPAESLRDIGRVCDRLLPGAELRRRLLFRYTLIWRKP